MESGRRVASVDEAVEEVIRRTGGDIRLGMPLGLGKPNQFVNALYRRAAADQGISLTIYTALSLGKPAAGSDLEARFLNPFAERVFGDYEELDYLKAVRRNALPSNIRVCEFFFQPGSLLGSDTAQRHYISSNYTHVARDLNAAGVNVAAQLVAARADTPDKLSLACNPEVSLDLLPMLMARRDAGETIIAVAQVHPDLPFMGNDAEVEASLFDLVIEAPGTDTRLFSTPNMPVALQDHLVGLNASTLVRDGGLLQIGIGALGDALVHHTLLREHHNDLYRELLGEFGLQQFADLIRREGGCAPFEQGLYGCSEMFTHGLMSLVDGGVIRRRVYDDECLQALINQGVLSPEASLESLDALREAGVLGDVLDDGTLGWLQSLGLMPDAARLEEGRLLLGSEALANDLSATGTRAAIGARIGGPLRGGTLMHGGFFLGPAAFYQRLRELPAEQAAAINMTHISFINQLYGDEPLKRLQRRDARFINTAFTATALGAAVSDQLEDGRVLSGVGGQYNFVCQAHELAGARSILLLRAWRERAGEAASNIVWSYGHTTIPRHLRDIFVTEYGIADVRGKTDAEVVAAMVNIADSRFQATLLEQARKAGKIAQDYQVPEAFRYNTPERLAERAGRFSMARAFPQFPLGCDFTGVEQRLLNALTWLKQKASQKEYLELGRRALWQEGDEQHFAPHLERMGLAEADGLRERLYRRLLLAALSATRDG